MTVYSAAYRHPELGELTLASDGDYVVGLWFEGQKYFGAGAHQRLESGDGVPVLDAARVWLDRYFAGDPLPAAALPCRPSGTAFQRRVWAILSDIPFGTVRTYADIAAQIAREDSRERALARAVGAANGRNPLSIILPCHRVVGSSGSLTGYAGGIERKIWLLEHEGVDTTSLYVPKRGTGL